MPLNSNLPPSGTSTTTQAGSIASPNACSYPKANIDHLLNLQPIFASIWPPLESKHLLWASIEAQVNNGPPQAPRLLQVGGGPSSLQFRYNN